MIVEVNYQVRLRNSNVIRGIVRGKVGESLEDIRLKILEQEGFKNHTNYVYSALQHDKVPQITRKVHHNLEQLEIEERPEERHLTLSKGRKESGESSEFEVSSMDYDDEAKEFLAVEPEKPPMVRGPVRQCNKFLCCFDSRVWLYLEYTQLKFYSDGGYRNVQQLVYIRDIIHIRTYRKKRYYFIRLRLREGEEEIELKYEGRDLCKQWMGYLMQAISFNKYLNQKQLYSKSESFKTYMRSLYEPENTRVIDLNQQQVVERSLYHELPEENSYQASFKKVIKLSQFKIISKIGSGSFSIVFLAQKGKNVFALKQLNKERLLLKNQMKYAITELNVLKKCHKCPFVIPLYYAFQTPQNLYLALKHIPTGDLNSYIKTNGALGPQPAFLLLEELVYAIQYLHEHKIIYRDLKPQNIMLDSKGHLYLIDFGLAKELNVEDQYAESFLGTPLYLPPQRFAGDGSINYKSDIYGVGCIFYEMLHGESVFTGGSYHSVVNKIRNEPPEISRNLPANFIAFLKQTLEKDPEKRLNRMSSHDIFKGTEWRQVAERIRPGVKVVGGGEEGSVQISYAIDQDYNQVSFPQRLVNGWYFSHEDEEE